MRKFNTLTGFLLSKTSNPAKDPIVEFSGYSAIGDGGKGQWKHNGATGQTPSQSPAQLGDAKLNDASGNQWDFIGTALFAEQIGGVLDGVTDNSLVTDAILAWSQVSGGNFYIGKGVYLTGKTTLVSKTLKVVGLGRDVSEWKLLDNENDHMFALSGTARFKAKSISLNQNKDNQTGGHGIRLGGCEELTLENVTIYNCSSYGIGAQAGTNKNMSVKNLTVHTTGNDGIDIKDYNLDNDTFFIDGYRCYNYGLSTNQQVALDVRGPVQAVNLAIATQGDNYGVRNRQASVQGRAGSGSVKGVTITNSDATATSIGLDMAGDSANFNVSDVDIDGLGLAIRQGVSGVGGTVTNLTAVGLIGVDCLSFSGSDLIVSNISCKNTNASGRIADFEPTANNIQINNFLLEDNSGSPSAVRIQALAQDIALSSGVVRNGNVSDSGTATVQSNVRVL